MKRLAFGVAESGAKAIAEWDDREGVPRQFYRAGRLYAVIMTAAVDHVAMAQAWASALGTAKTSVASHVRQS